MSTIKTNRIENVAGTHGFDVEDVIPDVKDSAWSGTVIADEQALRDFYGDQSITVQGANFSAKSYPDGSVVGSTDNGSFTMSANGDLECINGSVRSGVASNPYGNIFSLPAVAGSFPIVFKTPPFCSPMTIVAIGVPWGAVRHASVTDVECGLLSAIHTGEASSGYQAIGRWK